MENEVFTPLLEQFMLTPLVSWVKTVGQQSVHDGSKLSEYVELVDGIYLNQIMLEINPKATVQRTNKKVNNDSTLRIQNLSILIKQIKSYYQESLQQLVMMPLPNVLVLGRNPLSEQGLEEMRKLLLLLLGCAVQCEKKEEYIERIQSLDFDTKAAIAAHIQEVTHNQENVVDLQWLEGGELAPEDLDTLSRSLAFHLKRLVDERDDQLETIVELTQERDCGQFSPLAPYAQSPNDSPSMRRTESRQHLSVELADAKAKIRRLRQELEEKSEQLLDCRQELEHMETELKRIQHESQQLLSDARSARAYRDELDALREKAVRVDKLESEVGRYKERLHDIEFYKARVEELKEDNQVLLETKSMLEDQLEDTRSRSDKLHELEKESLQLKSKIHDMEMERDMDRKRMDELMEENLVLEMAQKQSMDESLHLGWELEQLSKTPDVTEVPQKSLGQEVNELTSSRLLKLEKENQTLLKTVEQLRGVADSTGEKPSRLLKANQENQRLTHKLEQLELELTSDRESVRSAEGLSTELMKEKALLEKTLDTLRENSERQVTGLEQENEHLTQTISSLRQRCQVGTEARVKDVEKENRVLHESIRETSSKLNKMEFERKQLRKDLELCKEKGERAEELELQVQRLERDNESLQKRVASLGITCEKVSALEKENSELEAETRRLKKKVDGLRNTSFQLEALEKENAQLDEENLELRRAAENLRSAGAKAAQLEMENRELESERSQLKRSMELLKASSKKTERLEVSYQGLDTENQRLQKALENSSRKISQLEAELQDVEAENQSLQRSLEELKISSKRLEQLEQENKTLEQESSQLEKDKKQLEKENKRLRQQAEIRDSKLDDSNQRLSQLEKENRTLGKEMIFFKDSCTRVKDLEKENKELVKLTSIDKKTLGTLREELVSEKLKTQQMNNDLEKLTHELEKIGLNKEGLLQDEQSSDRYKLLESKLESSLKSSLEMKEEKIAALEARLQESSNLNQQLRQELKTVKKNYEALRQREEEERMVQSSPPRGEEDFQPSRWEKESHEATRELLKVKDRLIEVERNNATLQAEKQALRSQLKQLETQSSNLQAQILALQRQTATLQENNTTLQTQNAKIQVETSTLNSQSAALMAQNAQLQSQQMSTESEKEGAVREKEDLRSTYELLLRDHEKLAALHERQASEYEALIGKHGGLKSAHKSLEMQHRDLEDRYNQLLKQKAQLEELEKVLKTEQEKMLSENKNHEVTAAEYSKLKEENEKLNAAHRQLVKDNDSLQADHKSLKTQMNNATLEQTRMEAEFSKLKEQYQQLDITFTKLTNQCELLSQVKGNLEEENRHLLDQIQTLMLQNRTLLEQTMESKDLFHVEQRQYIDKLNELRRQKEKLEEKIMDQYKFYDPSPPRRRGNWITLKMRKLIKPKSRERMRSLTLTPSRSESSEGFLGLPLDSQDSSSVGSGSNSLDDTLTQKRSSTLKRLPFMRNRSKDKDKAKAIYRRSMSMNDLLQTMALAGPGTGGQWVNSSDNLDGPEDVEGGGSGGQRMKELGSMAYSTNAIDYATLSLPAGHRGRQKLRVKDNASCEDVPASSEEPSGVRGQASRPSSLHSNKTTRSNSNNNSHLPSPLEGKGTLNGSLSRPHSESSGEFSLSLDAEVWSSSGSSPVQQPLSRSSHQSPLQLRKALETPTPSTTPGPGTSGRARKKSGSPGSEVVTLQQFLEESIDPDESGSQENLTVDSPRLSGGTEHVQKDRNSASTKGRGILRSASGRAAPVNSDSRPPRSGQPGRPTLRKAESTRVKGSVLPRQSLSSQGKATSVCERLDSASSSSTLPRASSVISTAEGTTRRTSIHDLLSKDNRQPVSVDPIPSSSSSSKAVPRATPSEYLPSSTTLFPSQLTRPSPPVPLPKSISLPCRTEEADFSSLESFFGSSFTVESVFMDSIFSEPAFSGSAGKNLPFLSLNPSLVSNISGPPGKSHPRPSLAQTSLNQSSGQNGLKPSPSDQGENQEGLDCNHVIDADQSPSPSPEDNQSLWYEYGCV
ncbi:girdin isoform X1 [Hypomesus transpacificus]|uniref:girdin isoform X1 n=1 Tax=Hypomesus transpacificus TaxID=137520 RepID=UPI001F07F71C|nr:girdin isoform X1 [Hypomesus transpacificus]